MNPQRVKRGDKVAIVSLSSGILGESFVKHELDLGVKRLEEMGLIPVFMNNSLKGLDYLNKHPEARAEDLKQAFKDKSIKMIISAIGGEDSYRLLPYLLSDEEFMQNVKNNPKIFTGYSDTTTTHLLLQKLGLNSFYGPAFITDFAEFEEDMLPYTKNAISYFFNPTSSLQILSSDVWYKDRTDFSPDAVGTKREAFKENRGYEVLMGSGKANGKLLGGCIEVLAFLTGKYLPDENRTQILNKYPIFPSKDEWKDKILFFETSEKEMTPEEFKFVLNILKEEGVFDLISGLIVGKPHDEKYYSEYCDIIKEELKSYNFPVLANLNFGHSFPRMVLPYGADAEIDADNKTLTILNSAID